MKKLLLCLIALVFIACSDNGQKEKIESNVQTRVNVVRETNATKDVETNDSKSVVRAFGMHPPLTVLLEILNPEGLIGLNYKPYPEDRDYMPPNIADLPVLGHMGNRSALFEKIVSLKPDVVFFGDSTPQDVLEPYQKVGIKTVRISGYQFEDFPAAIEAYKESLGRADSDVGKKADMLLAFVQKSSTKLESLSESITYRPTIYFAQGFDGLKSQCRNDNDTQELAYRIGGINALPCSVLNNPSQQVSINFEILASINPDVIFVRELPLFQELMQNPPKEWQPLKAFENHRIYYAPSTPSNWLMRPSSVMQAIGFLWAFAKVQPELLSEEEVKEEVQSFFRTFLRDLSDDDYERIQGLKMKEQ